MYSKTLKETLKEYEPLINSTVRRYKNKVANRYSEDDLISDCRMKLWKAHETYVDTGKATFGQYAKKIIEMAMYERFKRARNLRKNLPTATLTAVGWEDGNDSHQLDIPVDPEQPFIVTEYQLDTLKRRYSKVNPVILERIISHHLRGDSIKEISERDGVSVQAVYKSIKQGMATLSRGLNAAN